MIIKRHTRGFTLIEMLVVIAIIAVLVSVIIPVVGTSTVKAEAAADAANLRSVLGVLNAKIAVDDEELEPSVRNLEAPESRYKPGAKLHILYTTPGFIEVYYVETTAEGAAYYGLDYLADIAETGNAPDGVSTAKPITAGDWYIAGVGKAPAEAQDPAVISDAPHQHSLSFDQTGHHCACGFSEYHPDGSRYQDPATGAYLTRCLDSSCPYVKNSQGQWS